MSAPLAGCVVSVDLWGTLITDGDQAAASRWRTTEFVRVLTAFGRDVAAARVHRVLRQLRAETRARQNATGWQPSTGEQITAILAALGVSADPQERLLLDIVHSHAALRACPSVIPGARRALDAIKDSGARLVLTSNTLATSSAVHRQILAGLDLLDVFDAVNFSADRGVAKPDPRVFHIVAARESTGIGDLIHVGDDPRTDADAALAAGARAVLYDPGHRHGRPTIPTITRLDSLCPLLVTLRTRRT